MGQIYTNPKRASDPHALPDAEVFYANTGEAGTTDEGEPREAGWYWWACFPGCMPDSEPDGPYTTEQEAINAAQEGAEDDDPDLDRARVVETLRALLDDEPSINRDALRDALGCSPAELDARLREAREAIDTVLGD